MAKDVLITPANGDIQFKNASSVDSGRIQQDGDNLVISNAVGDVLLGDGSSDVYVGDGVNNVDIVFEQNGSIRGETAAGVTLTLGSADTALCLQGSSITSNNITGTASYASNADCLDGCTSACFYLATNPSGYTTCTGDITGVTAGVGLSGGGSSGDVTLTVDLSELTDMTATMVGTDEFIVLDASADRRKAANEIGLSIFSNDSGFTTCTGTVTSVGTTGNVNGITLTGTVTTSGTLTLGGTLANITVSQLAAAAVQTSGEAFSDSDTVLMTAAAVNDRIESFGYTTCTGDITGVTAGTGLSGGGASGAVTLDITLAEISAGTIVSASGVSLAGDTVNTALSAIGLTAFNNDAGYTTCTGDITGVTAGVGLSGGGSSGDVTLTVDLSELTDMTAAMVGTDEFIVLDASADRRKAANEIGLSIFSNDSGFTTCTGTVTSVGTTGNVNGITLTGTVTTSGTLTLGGTLGNITVSQLAAAAVQTSGEAFSDSDTVLMTAAAVDDRITSYGYTTCTGDITGVTAGTGLSGGGASGDVTLNVDLSELTDMTAAMVGTDEFIVLDASADRRKAANEIGLSIFSNDSGFTTCTGTVTSVGTTGNINGITLTGTVTTSGTLTLGGTLGNITVSQLAAAAVQTSGEAFSDSDTVLMTAAAIDDRITSYGYTTCTGDITGVTAGVGLSGGGTSGDLSLALDFSELTDMTGDISGTTEFIVQNGTTESRKAASEIKLSNFNNDSGWTTCTGDITGVTAGVGLSGGGASGDVTLTVDLSEISAGTIVSASGVSLAGDTVNTALSAINLSSFNNDSGFTTCTGDITGVTAGTGLSGGGTSGTVTLNLDFSELTDMTGDISGTTEFIVQNGTTESRKAASEIKLSNFNNDSGWTSCTGDITGVTAGTGLSGGGASGAVTLDIALAEISAGTIASASGVSAAGDTVNTALSDINISSFNNNLGFTSCTGTVTMTNGSSTRIVTSTSTTGLNGESDLTFSSGYLCNTNAYGVIQSSCIAAVGAIPALYTQKNSSGCIYLYSDEYCTCLNYCRTGHGFQINKATSGLALYVDPSSSPVVTINAASPQSNTLYVGGDVCVTDDLNVDSGTLFADVSENRVGIGTTAPSHQLHVKGTGLQYGVWEKTDATTGYVAFFAGAGQSALFNKNASRFRFGTATSTAGASFKDIFEIDSTGTNFVVNEDGDSDVDFRVESNNIANMLFVDASSDRVGVGTGSPASRLDIKSSAADNTGALRISDYNSSAWWAEYMGPSDQLYFLYCTLSHGGYLDPAANVGAIDFTGQHRSVVSNTFNTGSCTSIVGLIAVADGTYCNFDGSTNACINEALPGIKLSDTPNDKRVFGVISDKEDVSDGRTYAMGTFVSLFPTGSNETDRFIINSVGEGGMYVSNYNGNLENGDYITTSPLLGLGMKQNDDLLHNYTVAKITQDEDFTTDYEEVTYNGQTYRKAFVGVTYHSG